MIATLTIAFCVGASWNSESSRQSASWVSGAQTLNDSAAATDGSDTAPE